MGNFKKILFIGNAGHGNIFINIEYKYKKLSITGVEGPLSNGDSKGGAGQILDILKTDIRYTEDWNKDKALQLHDIWEKWHLNDMNAGCSHQKKEWALDKEIELTDYSWSSKYYNLSQKAQNGKLSTTEYTVFQKIAQKIDTNIGYNKPKYKTKEIENLLKEGWVKEGKKEIKKAHWVSSKEHPEGCLSKPCEICGYKYGSAWLFEPVPDTIIKWLYNLPESAIKPTWI